MPEGEREQGRCKGWELGGKEREEGREESKLLILSGKKTPIKLHKPLSLAALWKKEQEGVRG